MPQNVPSFDELLDSAQHSAVHLEMRDVYGIGEEAAEFEAWKLGDTAGRHDAHGRRRPWLDLIARTVGRGVVVRRARIVSEPVTDYIRFEHAGTKLNVDAGEQVRWLPRRRASDIALPGNDFWLIDERVVRWNHFTGDGDSGGGEMTEEPAAAKLCATAFEAVWERAVPHAGYEA